MPEMFATLNRNRMIKDFSHVSIDVQSLLHGLVEGAQRHLHNGLCMRVNMLEDSAVTLDKGLQSADAPLSNYLATKLTLLLNAYYLNLAGSLNNLAWALVYHHKLQKEINEDDLKQRRFAQLLGKDFLKEIHQRNLTSLHTRIQGFHNWYWDMREFRDPAAHRIPLLVPCSIYTEKDIIESNRLDAKAAELYAKGDHIEGGETFRQAFQLGKQKPVFISETTSVKMYDLAGRLNLDHANWYSIVSAVLSEGFS